MALALVTQLSLTKLVVSYYIISVFELFLYFIFFLLVFLIVFMFIASGPKQGKVYTGASGASSAEVQALSKEVIAITILLSKQDFFFPIVWFFCAPIPNYSPSLVTGGIRMDI